MDHKIGQIELISMQKCEIDYINDIGMKLYCFSRKISILTEEYSISKYESESQKGCTFVS